MAEELALGVITGFAGSPQQALSVVRDLEIPTVQVSYPARFNNAEGIQEVKDAVEETGIEITAVFCAFPGESYADIPTVQETVGLVPESTRAERVALIREISEFAKQIGVEHVAAHIGFIPEEANDPRYPTLVQTMQGVCDEVKARGQNFALETGQETAAGLRRFIQDVGRDNLRVNFDPANMILYGKDEPIAALNVLIEWIESVHCKDGKWPTEPNKLGHETPLGEGDVNIPEWIKKLLALGFRGPLTIEREISGEEQRRDIAKARDLLTELINKHRLC